MGNYRIAALTLMAAGASLLLCGCGSIDENLLDTQANTSVEINMPYATATPLPENMSAPEAIVIDADGNVTLNDTSVIEGDFQSLRAQEQQTEYRSLSLGNTGIAVQALQLRLKDLGYFDGDVSGLYDSDTEAAVKRFEQTFGTMQTGVATPKLQLKLFAATAPAYGTEAYNNAVLSQYSILRPGTVGSSVYALQQRLKNLDYPITDLTGVFDDQTAECVRLFYATYGLPSSDTASVGMQQELYADTAKRYSPDVQVIVTVPPDETPLEPAIAIPEDSGEIDESTAIALGNSGTRVSQIQQRLIALGYMAEGSDTGVFDQSTQEGVNRFLAAIGRTPNGMLTLDMQDFLLSSSAPAQGGSVEVSDYEDLAPGDSGDAVLALQRRLVELGYADGTPNGKYGPATISAVTFYQHCNGLEEDGLATAWLQSVLFSSRALTYDQTQMLSEGFGDQGAGETTVPAEEQDFATQEPQPEATPEPEPTPEPETDMLFFNLTLGSTGSAVMSLQNRLVELGYLEMPSTLYDEATRDAVVAFQNAIGVEPTGEASASLQRYIFSKAAPDASVRFEATGDSYAALQLGDTGDAVTNLQRRLWQLGFLDKADVQDSIGTFNDATRQAVIDAQLKMGYGSADGVAGVEFQSFLFSKYGNMLKEKKRG
ncbi:MAG: peptidoglycan-binding protein [Clostridia bacterium]|nr:peptidoglycan-binding protein [Clostridia bacterium]